MDYSACYAICTVADKPDIRFDMQFVELNEIGSKGKGFKVFDKAELASRNLR